MYKKILIFISCDGLKGLIHTPESFLVSSKYKYFRKLGEFLTQRKKSQRAKVINGVPKTKITIILPAYNSADTINKAIRSIQDQSYSHWELLIIDDGSTDETLKIVKSVAKKDQRIIVLQNIKNMGVAYSRNVGMFFAKGDFITFHDADDYSHHERLEYQLAPIISHPSCRVVIPQYVRVNIEGNVYLINGRHKWNRVSGMLFPRKVIDELGYFKPINISEDSEYYERIIAVYGKQSKIILCKVLYYALFSPDSLLFSNASFSVDNNSISYQINDTDFNELQELRQKHKLIENGDLSAYQSFQVDLDVTKVI